MINYTTETRPCLLASETRCGAILIGMIYITAKTVDARHDTTLPREIMAIRLYSIYYNPISPDTTIMAQSRTQKIEDLLFVT